MRCRFGSERLLPVRRWGTRGGPATSGPAWGETTMQRSAWQSVLTSLVTGTLLILGAGHSQAGDWGFRMVGDLGGAPKSLADPLFKASKHNFEYSSRGLELGVAWKDWDAGVFLYTVNKGYLERGYSEAACGPWLNGQTICTPNGVPLREGTIIQSVGLRLVGARVGHFFTLVRPAKWIRFGIPIRAALATYTNHALQWTYSRGAAQTAAGTSFFERCPVMTADGQCVPQQVQGEAVFAHGKAPYPIVSGGIGVKVRTASWAEFEVCLLAENPRLPVVSWGMTFRKHSK
jgi:hypothetical protein